MAVSGIFGWLNLRKLAFSVEFPDEIYDGRETLATIRLANGKRFLPSFLIRAAFAGAETGFLVIGRDGAEKTGVPFTLHGRGARSVGEVSISSSFPINFFTRYKKYDIGEECVVFPAPRECSFSRAFGTGGAQTDPSSLARGQDGDLLKIVDYTGNEPIKMIHWRLSARHEEFKVKEMAASASSPVILDLERLAAVGVERAVSCGAFLVNRLIRQNRPVGLAYGSVLIGPGTSRPHRLRLLTHLAVYGKD